MRSLTLRLIAQVRDVGENRHRQAGGKKVRPLVPMMHRLTCGALALGHSRIEQEGLLEDVGI